MNILNRWWKGHGTKILGIATLALGSVQVFDGPVNTLLGAVYGPKVMAVLTMASGVATFMRGLKNTATIAVEKVALEAK